MDEFGISIDTGHELPLKELTEYALIKPALLHLIKIDYPGFGSGMYISNFKLNDYRKKYLEHILKKEKKELSSLEKEVLESIEKNTILSENVNDETVTEYSLGARVADRIAEFGGSWTFIISFFMFILGWMIINIFLLASKPFDPYPFILLNLILSCLAAIQAPIIMMSQNRQEQKDRLRSEHDYKVNLKAELEIRLLNEKIDHLIIHQNKRLMEVQEIQLEYLEQILNK